VYLFVRAKTVKPLIRNSDNIAGVSYRKLNPKIDYISAKCK